MDDAELKLMALRKVYADALLNTSKEAAARVMESDKRSARYQHELKVAKEESLRLLMRLKQMMDSKTSEAETTSLNQQIKIKELEAQLEEAEDIVRDLRGELAEVRAELDGVNNEYLHLVNGPENECSGQEPVDTINYSHQSPYESSVHYDAIVPYVGNRELPSIISRGKQAGLCRNGCTQRIRACERNLLEENDAVKDTGNDAEHEKCEYTSRAPTSDNKILGDLQSEPLKDIKLSTFLQKRKRATRRRKAVICLPPILTSDKPEPESVKDSTQSSKRERNLFEICGAKKMRGNENEIEVGTVDAPSKGLQVLSSDAIDALPSQTVRDRVVKYTFQRRRKRQASGGSSISASLKTKKTIGDEQKGDQKLEQAKSSSLMESAQDSRSLAEVARQLISLSKAKWWH